MKIIDVVTSPWAISPEKLIEIKEIYQTHLRGDKIDIKGIEARLGRQLVNPRQEINIINGVAIVSLHGIIAKRFNLFQEISGGASTQIFSDQIKIAAFDDDVKAILLDIDSSGGTVDGSFEAAQIVFEAREHKPVVSFVDGTGASAGYLIAAAAEKVFISGPATITGSIDVVITHIDKSNLEKNIGVKTTEITHGKFKRIATQYEPLSKEAKEHLQNQVDFMYTVFVEKVALFRGVSVETVLNDMADGRLFIGQQAIDANLVDGFSTLDALVEQLSNGVLPQDISTGVLSDTEVNRVIEKLEQDDTEMGKDTITKGYILEHHPEVAASLRQDGIDSVDVTKAASEAKQDECERIKGVHEQSVAGHEDLINELMFDGKTDAGMAAVQILKCDKGNRQEHIDKLEQDAAQIADKTIIPEIEKVKTDRSNMSVEDRCKLEWDESADVRDEYGNFDAFVAYETAMDNGQIKRLGEKS